MAIRNPSHPNRAHNDRNTRIFTEGLKDWREWLVDLQKRLCRDVVTIAFANRGCLGANPLDWVNECIDNYWTTHRPGFKNWAALACDLVNPEGWTAPGWLLGEVPEEILRPHIRIAPLAETLDGRVVAPYTEVIRSQIASLIEMRIHMARIAVLDDAKIKIASEPAPKRAKPSASSIKRVNEAVYAIGRKYGDEWNAKWFESTRGAYADLHPMQVEHAVDESSPTEPTPIDDQKAKPEERARKLPPKKRDLSHYFDDASLTDAQRKAASLRFEYEMSVTAIAKYLGRHRTSVQETLASATRKMEVAKWNEQRAKKRAEKNPGGS